MKQMILTTFLLFAVGCTQEVVKLKDNSKEVAANKAEIELLKAQDALHSLQIEELGLQVQTLENELQTLTETVETNELKLVQLCDEVSLLDEELQLVKDELDQTASDLYFAIGEVRSELLLKIKRLRKKLVREIRLRKLADNNLQDQIDSLEDVVENAIAKQKVINQFLKQGLALLNLKIYFLKQNIQSQLNSLDSRVSQVESDVSVIYSEIDSIKDSMSLMQAQLDDVESRLVEVVDLCGNGKEVLLKTQDGLVGFHLQFKTVTLTISDTITIPEQVIPGHWDKYKCPFGLQYCSTYISEIVLPETTYTVSDTVKVKVLDKGFLDVIENGTWLTTDGKSCKFKVVNGEVVEL